MVSLRHMSNTVVFYDQHYPQFCKEDTLHRLVPGSFRTSSASDLAESLEQGCSLLISFHGAYFPKAAWGAILRFLEQGGNLAIFGGMPFSCPITRDRLIEPEQDAYTRQIFLGPFFRLSSPSNDLQFVAHEEATLLKECPLYVDAKSPGTFWSFNPRLTQVSDHAEDLGSAGPVDTLLQPLIHAQSTNATGRKHRVATPALLLDQRSGRFKGGRWLLSLWQPLWEEDWLKNEEAIQRLISLAAQGATIFDVRPTLGCYQSGESPSLLATTRTGVELQVRISVYPPDPNQPLQHFELTFPASPFQQEQVCRLASQQQPGLYRARAEYQPSDGLPLMLESGFWIWDEQLVASTRNKRLTARRDHFYQEDRLFLVYGTTYMDSRVQRKFLHLPNPTRWDRDLTELQAAGINLLRTGIWTAWRELVPVVGVANEAFLRALDAFVLTACKHAIQVIFTFFSFFPPPFEGENPWLDPRSVEAQQDFVALLARRYARVELLSWDLINEPSFGDPARIFAQRPLPNYDRFEVEAFQLWLAERYTLTELQLRWRQTPADLPDWAHVQPPQEADYITDVHEIAARLMLKVADYTRFSQEIFQNWAAKMVEVIRASGSQTLVGVGQDESGSRIAPQFYASAVDYTTTHPWWNIDDLLWDMLLDKTLEKPNLIQEIGVMQLRDIDGRPWRSEQANAYLLERKLITGLIGRGAGLIQWLWHTNSYMTNDNENSIGLVHADGSAKPELEIMEEFGRLTQALEGQLVETPTLPEVWVVVPYSQWFVRPDLGRLSTQQAVRVLGYELGIIPQLISEYQLHTLKSMSSPPLTVIVPALQLLDPQAWQHLQTYVQSGGTLLVNGVITRDTHNLLFNLDLEGFPTDAPPLPVSRYENLEDLHGQIHWVSFEQEKISYVRKAHNHTYCISEGAGTLIWCGLPLELAGETTATRALYTQAMGHAGAKLANNPILVDRKTLKEGQMILIVSEANQAQSVKIDADITVTIAPNRAGALLLGLNGEKQTFGGLTL